MNVLSFPFVGTADLPQNYQNQFRLRANSCALEAISMRQHSAGRSH